MASEKPKYTTKRSSLLQLTLLKLHGSCPCESKVVSKSNAEEEKIHPKPSTALTQPQSHCPLNSTLYSSFLGVGLRWWVCLLSFLGGKKKKKKGEREPASILVVPLQFIYFHCMSALQDIGRIF